MKYLIILFLCFSTWIYSESNTINTDQLTFYYTPRCPFCLKVMRFMDEHSIKLPMKDCTEPKNAQELISIGGKRQVPCLVINGEAMYESQEIIEWMKEHLTDS